MSVLTTCPRISLRKRNAFPAAKPLNTLEIKIRKPLCIRSILMMRETTTSGITECVGCGELFLQANKFQTRCRKGCGRKSKNGARARKRVINAREFIGIDGEGVTRPNGEHIYDMLSVGSETLTNPDGSQLHYRQIFEFLYSQFQANPGAIFVGFFLGYDFNQWFRTLPEERAAMLLTPTGRAVRQRKNHSYLGPFPVDDGMWEFDILGMKRFKLRPHGSEDETAWMYINDAGPFFQTSFLNVINPRDWDEPILTDAEYEIIETGKSERNIRLTQAEQLRKRAETTKYNCLENDVMARVMSRLNIGFTSIGVRLKKDQWYGPGQAAQAWMRLEGIPTHDEIIQAVPEWAWDTAQKTYFGGWFEIFAHGHVEGTSYEYDINSAYPHIIANLPCLLHGSWTRSDDGTGVRTLSANDIAVDSEYRYTMVHATVTGSNPIVGTMIHRNKQHRNCRPHNTKGWFWKHELDAAMRARIVDHADIHEWVSYRACKCSVYGDKMRNLYAQRLRVGKNSPEGKAYKLIYNSAYGKHAQSIGNPRYANSIYASLITAGCRTMILDAIATHPTKTESLLMVATDGVYFREPHPSLELSSKELGKWDVTEKQNLTLYMPGVYWDDATRELIRDGESPKLKSRGISAKDLAARIEELDRLFTELKERARRGKVIGYEDWPKLKIPIDFNMVSATQALARGKWETAGTIIHDDEKEISASPITKRIPEAYLVDGILRSMPWVMADQLESTPYDKSFGKPEEIGMSDDGPLEKLMYDMMHAEG